MADRPTDKQLQAWKVTHGGSWGYDEQRRKITLRHTWLDQAHIERGESMSDCVARRTRRRRDVEETAEVAGDGTVRGLLDDWLLHASINAKAQTISSYTTSAKHIARYLGATTKVRDLTSKKIEAMFAAHTQGRRSSTVKTLSNHWGQVRRYGARHKMLPRELASDLAEAELPKLGVNDSKDKEWFDLHDFEVVRSHLIADRTPQNMMFLTMMLCGLRPGEALGLKWQYVDLVKRQLRADAVIERHGLWTHTMKTDRHHPHAHRTIPIPADLALALRDIRPVDVDPNSFVFSERGKHLGVNVGVNHALRIAAECRVKPISPNGYRHTFASICRHNGMPYEQLAKLMGHKDTQQIIHTYGHPMAPTTPVDLDRFLGTAETDA
jgi:integrase